MAAHGIVSQYGSSKAETQSPPTKSMQEVMTELLAMGYDPLSKKNAIGADYVASLHHDTYEFIKPGQFDLKGRAVFITGASRGLGRSIAISYARAGASYIGIGARSSLERVEKEILDAANNAGRIRPKVLSVKLDVTSKNSVAHAVAEIKQAFGRCDIVVNNSGYIEPAVKMTEVNPDEWWRVFEVNILGMFLVTRAFIPLIVESQNSLKTIAIISSQMALTKFDGGSAYQMTKFATMRFSELCNAEYGDQGLLSYHVHPGGVDTDLASAIRPDHAQFLMDTPELGADTMVWLTARRWEWLAGRYVNALWDMKELEQKRERIVREDHLKMRMSVGLD